MGVLCSVRRSTAVLAVLACLLLLGRAAIGRLLRLAVLSKCTVNGGIGRGNDTCIWSKARSDRGGASIHDMLYASAFAASIDRQYCGACDAASVGTILLQVTAQQARLDRARLLAATGLQTVLPSDCPPVTECYTPSRVYRHDKYLRRPTWLSTVRSIAQRHVATHRRHSSTRSAQQHRIVVHIRRGDVNPHSHPERYLPNSYYLEHIQKYRRNTSEVIIFSEAVSHERFDAFLSLGYDLRLDTLTQEVWQHAIDCDVFIMSMSSFSYVPATLSRATVVVYHPFWHAPLDGWVVASPQPKPPPHAPAPHPPAPHPPPDRAFSAKKKRPA